MRVVLINSPSKFLEEPDIQPPLGLLYLAAVFEFQGHDVSVLDYNVQDYSVRGILDYDLYCFTATTPQYPAAVKLAKQVDGLKVIGGPHATSVEVDKLWDVVVKGEGENAVSSLTSMYHSRRVLCPKLVEDLDTIPFPARHLVDLDKYKRTFEGKPVATLISARGCPYSCNYCDKDMWGYKVRRRSVENVAQEIVLLKAVYDYEAFLFVDDSFTLNRAWILELCQFMRRAKVVWRCWTRVDIVDLKLLQEMADSGCRNIGFGIESGSDTVLKKINKGTRVWQGIQAIKRAKDSGLKVKVFLMAGFPFDTDETINSTIKFVEDTDPDEWGLGTFIPIPGSDMYKNPSKYGIRTLSSNYEDYVEVGKDGKGGASFTPMKGSYEDLAGLRDKLLDYLKSRGKSK